MHIFSPLNSPLKAADGPWNWWVMVTNCHLLFAAQLWWLTTIGVSDVTHFSVTTYCQLQRQVGDHIFGILTSPLIWTHLLDLPNLDHLTAVARLRMIAHRLAIETGRHVRTKICKEDRICKNCDIEEIEDESYFRLICPLYCQQQAIQMRTVLSFTTSMSQEELFIVLMKS